MTVSGKPVTVEAALSEVERECQVRSRCYDRWIQDGKMSRIDAQDRLDRLVAAFELLGAAMKKLGTDYIITKSDDVQF